MTTQPGARTTCLALTSSDDEVARRVCAEFLEMPGMRLSLPQAARLFALPPARCGRILEALVCSHDLWTDGITFALAGGVHAGL